MLLKQGDVIFTVDKDEEYISSLSKGHFGYSYFHCSLYIGGNQLIESDKDCGVIISKLDKYKDNINMVARADIDAQFITRLINVATEFVGKEYNKLFLPDTDKFYCSELIHRVYRYANADKPFFTEHTLNYIKDGVISEYWQKLYAKHGVVVPQGEKGSHPNNLSQDDKFIKCFFL